MACHGEVEIIQGAQNIAGNYTTVTANFYCVRDSGYAYSGYTTYAWCVLDGVGQTITVSGFDISASNPKILIGSITKNIYHNSDGTKTVSASFSWDSQNNYVGTITGSASKVLTTIPRTSSVSCNSFNIGDATTIVISRASSSFTHTVTWAFGNASGTIATKTTQTTIGTTIPAASLYAQIPNAKSGTGTITCKTYSGDNLIGTSTCNFTAYAKEADCIPTISATITDINDATIALTGSSTKFIKGFSTAKVVASATAKNSATISNYKITAGTGDGRTSNTATINFTGINSNSITVTATDSRGYSKSVNYTLDWIEYVKLAFTSITIQRPESTADKANMAIKGNYFNNSFGSVSNSLILKYRYKESGGTYSEWITLTHTITDNTFTYTELLENLDHNKEYLFEFMIDDQLMIVYSEEIILTKGIPVLRVGKDYVRVNDKLLLDEDNCVAIYGGGNLDPNTTLHELILTCHSNAPERRWLNILLH